MASPHQTADSHRTAETDSLRCWHVGSNAGATESYNCYKIIAKDLNLAKPWEESDKKEPDSLVDSVFAAKKKLQDWGAAHPKKYG